MITPAMRLYIIIMANKAKAVLTWKKISLSLNISKDTLKRWCRCGVIDNRVLNVNFKPKNKLSPEERALILFTCNTNEFKSLIPDVIFAKLADKGEYIGSASTIYRVLKEAKQMKHRGKSKASKKIVAPVLSAKKPNELWSWDITYLPGPVKGLYFFLYLIMDIYSRKIVGHEIYDRESSELAAELIEKTVLKEGGFLPSLILHSDNGSPMKGSTMLAKLSELKIKPSNSRPHVSNDNPFSESLFKTLKYIPAYPEHGFKTIEDARKWTLDFTDFYNNEHCHSGIDYVTPNQRHDGKDEMILNFRKEVVKKAKAKHPERWSGKVKVFEIKKIVGINMPKDLLKMVG